MPVQMTIIGLGQVGASIGMALAQHKNIISTVGHDIELAVERAALKKGAVEKTEHNLPRAIKDAHIVLLALPVLSSSVVTIFLLSIKFTKRPLSNILRGPFLLENRFVNFL